MEKKEIRIQYRQQRCALTEEIRFHLSQQITDHFFNDPSILACLNGATGCVHTYLPGKQPEVDTWPLIHRLWRDFPSVRIWSSIMEPTNRLSHFELTANTILMESRWGIPLPVGDYKRVSGSPDLVIVPLLAFDTNGHRVGYGGGYYDRFLADTSSECLKLGLSFFDPIAPIDDVVETDIRLDGCITPETIYWFS